jgi:hypothetical protein
MWYNTLVVLTVHQFLYLLPTQQDATITKGVEVSILQQHFWLIYDFNKIMILMEKHFEISLD